MNTLGIDIGTSSVKIALLGDDDRVIATASRSLNVSRPHPGWSEQQAQDWWTAIEQCFDELQATQGVALSAVAAIGLSGQMHGATLLDADGAVLRPCILWNDGRSGPQCERLTREWPDLHAVTGNLAMPGFTAPKLMWVAEHEPDVMRRVAKVLLPKAYVRYRLCGDYVEDMSDASGTLWLDVARRDWSDAALAATGMRREQLPRLVEGNAVSGALDEALSRRWGFAKPPLIAGGAGDNAAGAVGLGAIAAGDAFVSLGTSGVLWATTAAYAPAPARAVHAFCHALPNTWHQMGVLLEARRLARLVGRRHRTARGRIAGRARRRPGALALLVRPLPERRAHAAQRRHRARRLRRPHRRQHARGHDAGRAGRRGLRDARCAAGPGQRGHHAARRPTSSAAARARRCGAS